MIGMRECAVNLIEMSTFFSYQIYICSLKCALFCIFYEVRIR